MSIITKKGDKGKSQLFSGETVSKNHPRLETYGTLDELVSFMGLARSLCKSDIVVGYLLDEQERLFKLGTELATKDKTKVKYAPIDDSDVKIIEETIDKLELKVKLPKTFIIPGNTATGATFDVARTIARRFERLLVALSDSGEFKNPSAIIYSNRLSALLYLMARLEDQK